MIKYKDETEKIRIVQYTPKTQDKQIHNTRNGIFEIVPNDSYDFLNKITLDTAVPISIEDRWKPIGYKTEATTLTNALDYACKIKAEWDPNRTDYTGWGRSTPELVYFPVVDTSKAVSMRQMFSHLQNLKIIPILDTHNVSDLSYLFNHCTSLVNAPLIDLSNCTTAKCMFAMPRYRASLKTITFTGNPSKLTDVTDMFGKGRTDIEPIEGLPSNGTLIYDHRYDYTIIIDELKKHNSTWVAKSDNEI